MSRRRDPSPARPDAPSPRHEPVELPPVPPAPGERVAGRTVGPDREGDELALTWADRPGLYGWLASTDHKSIGRRFLFTAFTFFALGGVLAALMRIQLSRPENHFLSADRYNQIFTVHGTTMMFLFATPVMLATAVSMIPLVVGARAIAFPRLVAFGYWMFLLGGTLLWVCLLMDMGPDTGWFAYFPLTGPEYSPGHRVDVWAQLVNFTEISSLVLAVAIVTTIVKLRVPGMSLDRLPLYAWSMLVQGLMIVFAMPSIITCSGYMMLDRLVNTHLFNVAEGGDPLLWQHLFWFFGHPEVYIIFIPALGMLSAIVSANTRRPVFGYTAMVLSQVATGFVGFGLWVHHMFATPLPQIGESFFTAASILIAIPSGVQIFCWIATIWTGRPVWRTSFLFVVGFIATFVIGGLTGVMLDSVPIDLQVHDTFFVVAHFHYVLIGGAVFPLLGAMYHWFPKLTGRLMSERLGRWSFALVFLGFHLTFFPQHILGMMGMPRRVYTYVPETGWGPLNQLSSVGAAILATGFVLTALNALRSARRGEVAGYDPWAADSLEWATSSPPPPHNFTRPPIVDSRQPLWTRGPDAAVVTGLATDRREILVTRVLDAAPDSRDMSPEPSIWPFVTALLLGIMLVGLLFTPWAFVAMLVPVALGCLFWYWPKRGPKHHPRDAVEVL